MCGGQQPTCRGDEHLGPAAREAVQQSLGPDVGVEQRGRAAQLGQAQPGHHEPGLVPQEQRHRGARLQARVVLQGTGHLVTASVHLRVGVRIAFKVQEGLGRMLLRCFQEAVQNAVEGFESLVESEPCAQF